MRVYESVNDAHYAFLCDVACVCECVCTRNSRYYVKYIIYIEYCVRVC